MHDIVGRHSGHGLQIYEEMRDKDIVEPARKNRHNLYQAVWYIILNIQDGKRVNVPELELSWLDQSCDVYYMKNTNRIESLSDAFSSIHD